jgi:putative pyruvate formate lyase activating enzyme
MKISRGGDGEVMTPAELSRSLLDFQNEGAAVIDLVTPTHFAEGVCKAVALAKEGGLTIPVVYNTGGYERTGAIRALSGTVDIFLTDFKYGSEAAGALSHAADYLKFAASSLREMLRMHPVPIIGADGVMRSGVIVRHLVLPGLRRDSENVLREIRAAENDTGGRVMLSLMRQYTPAEEIVGEAGSCEAIVTDAKLRRRVTSFEYEYVADIARDMGFAGYFQGKASADASYTPEF